MSDEWRVVPQEKTDELEYLFEQGEKTAWFRVKGRKMEKSPEWQPIHNLLTCETQYVNEKENLRLTEAEFFLRVGFVGMSDEQIVCECERILTQMGKKGISYIYQTYTRRYTLMRPSVLFFEDRPGFTGVVYAPEFKMFVIGESRCKK